MFLEQDIGDPDDNIDPPPETAGPESGGKRDPTFETWDIDALYDPSAPMIPSKQLLDIFRAISDPKRQQSIINPVLRDLARLTKNEAKGVPLPPA
jgi:hypothetical protein